MHEADPLELRRQTETEPQYLHRIIVMTISLSLMEVVYIALVNQLSPVILCMPKLPPLHRAAQCYGQKRSIRKMRN